MLSGRILIYVFYIPDSSLLLTGPSISIVIYQTTCVNHKLGWRSKSVLTDAGTDRTSLICK